MGMATEAGSARILGDRASASPPTTATNAAPANANVAPGDNRDFIAFMSASSWQQLLQQPPDGSTSEARRSSVAGVPRSGPPRKTGGFTQPPVGTKPISISRQSSP